ncbi:MAG: hypothetical protein NC328_04850 [Muribaculum sp.]|nr:hypothetical protein [Muribaculum sp.]
MKKAFYTLLAALTLSAPAVQAEVWEGTTTPVPADAVYLNPGTSPGVYSELVGTYAVDLSGLYYQISSTARSNGHISGDNPIFVYVVNESNEIVFTGDYKFATPAGGRSLLDMAVTIPEENKITTPGTYYIIFPTGKSNTEPNQAYINPRNYENIYDLKVGPYIVAEPKAAVDAQFTVTPQGEFPSGNLPGMVTFTMAESAKFFNVGDLEGCISLLSPAGSKITMEPGVKSGNVVTWEFPNDFNKAAGQYTIEFDFSTFSAFTTDYAPYKFPAKGEYHFTITDGKTFVTPQFTTVPAEREITDWDTEVANPAMLGISLTDYKLASAIPLASLSNYPLTVVTPSNETLSLALRRASLNQFQFTVPTGTFKEVGTYRCFFKIAGLDGVSATDATDEVILENISFDIVIKGIPDPEDAIVELTPDGSYLPYAAPTAVELLVSNAAAITITPGKSLLTVTRLATRADSDVVATVDPVVSGNKITWALPTDLEEGNYESTVTFDGITAKTAEGAEIVFPTEPLVQQFSITTPDYPVADLTATVTPAAGFYKEWTANQINVDFKNYRLEGTKVELPAFKARPAVLTLPDGTTTDLNLKQSGGSSVKKGYYVVPEGTFSQEGKYTLTVPVGGLVAYPQSASAATDENRVILNNYVIEYSVGIESGIEAINAEEANTEYYDLNGVKLDGKPTGGMYIKVVNGQGSIVIVK